MPSPAQNVFVSRIHVRYDRDHFPEDLRFQETGDRDNFQGRYVLQHAWNGESQCAAAEVYRRGLPERQDKEAQTLASLTGWDIDDIRGWAGLSSNPRVPAETEPWWKRLWSRE
ncbi:MAG: hypothetical protein GY723_00630 [bacterium]|nr:hypothetical protein [bacterium]